MTAQPTPALVPGERTVNISPMEREGQTVIGLAAIVAGVVLLASAGSPFAMLLEGVLIAGGWDLAITGGLGLCPLYVRLAPTDRQTGGRR